MSDETLKPCPFCGGKAALHMSWMGDGHRYRAVKCVECGATTPGNYSEVGDQSIWDWNTRAEHGTLIAEQVREAIEEAKAELMESCEYVGDMYQRQSDVLKAFGKMEQAIADELNARAERTCSGIMDYDGWFICDNCGCQTQGDQYYEKPNYCASCGARVRGE